MVLSWGVGWKVGWLVVGHVVMGRSIDCKKRHKKEQQKQKKEIGAGSVCEQRSPGTT